MQFVLCISIVVVAIHSEGVGELHVCGVDLSAAYGAAAFLLLQKTLVFTDDRSRWWEGGARRL